jgi:hypothetical protein
MAFPLFVVVVGVDPRWVTNALKKKHKLHFEHSHHENTQTIRINATDYLEKIFQVPFQLKKASDSEVKNMLEKLSSPMLKLEPNVPNVNEKKGEEEEKTTTSVSSETIVEPSKTTNPLPTTETDDEQLYLEKWEVESIQKLSTIIGNSPRTLKRFVNIYLIVRAHEEIKHVEKDRELEIKLLQFLVALPLGSSDLYKRFIECILKESNIDLKLKECFSGGEAVMLQNFFDDDYEKIKLSQIRKFLPLTSRFTFDCH